MTNFEKYKELKEQLNIEYKGVKLNRVVAINIWFLAVDGKLKATWKTLFLFLFTLDVKKLNFDSTKHQILSTFGRYLRKDYLELYENVWRKLEGKASYNNTMTWKRKLSFHPLIGIRIYKEVLLKLQGSKCSFWEKLKIASNMTYYCNIIEGLETVDFSQVKKYMCLCSMHDYENLMTQYLKLKGTYTYTLQEGIYFLFHKDPPIDAICYENMEADNLLCWGEYTKNEYSKYGISKERLLVSGYPKEIPTTQMKNENKFKKVIVLLARDSFRLANINLLDALLKMPDRSFALKLHPSCDYDFYKSFIGSSNFYMIDRNRTVNECLTNVEFDLAIAVNTTAYYEALIRGLPCFRFVDESFDLMCGMDDTFNDFTSFNVRIDELINRSVEDYQNNVDDLLKYAIGFNTNNYKTILLKES